MTINQIVTEAEYFPPRTLIYGSDGIGKTTFAARSPNPIFITTEDGATRVPVAKFPHCKSSQDVTNYLHALYGEDHDYKTVVLDSADWAQALSAAPSHIRLFSKTHVTGDSV